MTKDGNSVTKNISPRNKSTMKTEKRLSLMP